MSLAIATPRVVARPQEREPRWVITAFVSRSCVRGALIWGVVFGIWVLSTIKAFVSGYPTIADRQGVARSFGAFSMFLGDPHHLETVAGFTMWRILTVIVTIGAIWGLMTSTSMLRGEEEAGRWELLLCGRTTRGQATAQALLGLALATLGMYAVAASLTLAAARLPGAHFSLAACLLFALAMVSGAAMFGAIGAVTSQLSATRGQARMLAGVVLAAAYVLRMMADSSTSMGWLRWVSPIGWVEEFRPLRDMQPIALVPILALTAACSMLAVWLAGRRDVDASVLRESERGIDSSRWLRGPLTLALRVSGPTALIWFLSTAGIAAMYGSLTRSATSLMTSSSMFSTAFSRLGLKQMSEAYLGVVFLMLAVLISFIAASQLAGIREEEASGRLDNLLVRPVSRVRWLVGRLGFACLLVLACGVGAGVFAWWGAALQHTGEALPKLVEAGVNASMPGIFVIGAGALVMGLRPRLTSVAAYGIVAWSFLTDLLGALIKNNDLVRDSSLFTHIKLAPAATPEWSTNAIMVAIALAAAALGTLVFRRRDLENT